MPWVSIISGVIFVGGLVAFIIYFRKSLAHDAEQHAKEKKSRDHLSTYGDTSDPL